MSNLQRRSRSKSSRSIIACSINNVFQLSKYLQPLTRVLGVLLTYMTLLLDASNAYSVSEDIVTQLPSCNVTTEFRCRTGACINMSLVCDGKGDCEDSSDEDRIGSCSYRLSAGLIAAITIGSLVGAVLVCCWIGSLIECVQHMYKYWCSCCHDDDLGDITFTTVIPNPAAETGTLVVARGQLPPSYSSIFRNETAFAVEAIRNEAAFAMEAMVAMQSAPPVRPHLQTTATQQYRQTHSIAVQVPEYPPPSYYGYFNPTKDNIRWC